MKKVIRLTENDVRAIVKNSVRRILRERRNSRNGKNMLAESKRSRQARERSKQVLSRYFNPEEVNQVLAVIENTFFKKPNIQNSWVMKLEPLFCKIACEECGLAERSVDHDKINQLGQAIDNFANYPNRLKSSDISLSTTTLRQLVAMSNCMDHPMEMGDNDWTL